MNPHPFLALITPIGDTGGPPPGGGGQGGPVDPGYSPPWARPNPPYPDNSLPGGQGGYPSHPIYRPDVYPDNSLPGNQPYPDQGLPGQQPRPDQGLPPFPSHPIYLPPDAGPDEPRLVSKVVWTPQTGWVVVFVPTGPTPTPSTE